MAKEGSRVNPRSKPHRVSKAAKDGLPISVIVPTVRGWSAAKPAFQRLVPQTLRAGGEVVVMDGSGGPPPSAEEMGELGGPIAWVSRPGASVFQLRLEGYNAARGDVVAVTEDHCQVAPDWVARTLDAHRRHPEAGAVGGAVLNGTDQKLVDWAAFLLTQGPFMPPLANGMTDRISGPANVSYKRRVLQRLKTDDPLGLIDFLELPTALEGESLVADDSIRVLHHQSQGFWGTSLAEFDNGRTIAGFRRRRMGHGDWLRILGAPLLPIYRSVRALRICRRKQTPAGVLPASVPLHVWLQYCAMAGELAGYAAGPGDSPRRLY
jgi:Glycosyl transferase family 2